GSVLGSLIADRVGRRPGIVILSLAWGISGVAYAHAETDIQLMAVGFAIMVSAYALVALGYSIYVPELFPTRLRMRGAGLAGATGRLAASGAQFGVVWAFNLGGVSLVSGFMAGLLGLLAVVVLVAGVETRQRSLEDLAADLGATDAVV
ncbi:MAG TPA: MFS transporter, partial [Rhodopila sp.]|uniref:MFS transporter n=1 Tax=Rhodopila sp. TaxID=2480087 RepID=UPI002CF8A862